MKKVLFRNRTFDYKEEILSDNEKADGVTGKWKLSSFNKKITTLLKIHEG